MKKLYKKLAMTVSTVMFTLLSVHGMDELLRQLQTAQTSYNVVTKDIAFLKEGDFEVAASAERKNYCKFN